MYLISFRADLHYSQKNIILRGLYRTIINEEIQLYLNGMILFIIYIKILPEGYRTIFYTCQSDQEVKKHYTNTAACVIAKIKKKRFSGTL
jgi:hypothetical protein